MTEADRLSIAVWAVTQLAIGLAILLLRAPLARLLTPWIAKFPRKRAAPDQQNVQDQLWALGTVLVLGGVLGGFSGAVLGIKGGESGI